MKVRAYNRIWDVYPYRKAVRLGIDIVANWRKYSETTHITGKYMLTDDWYCIPIVASNTQNIITPFGKYKRSWLYAWYEEPASLACINYYQDAAYLHRSCMSYRKRRAPIEMLLAQAVIESGFDFRKAVTRVWDASDYRVERNFVRYIYHEFIQELLMDTIKAALEASGVTFGDQVKRLNQLATDLEIIVSQVAAEPDKYTLESVGGMAKVGGELSSSLMGLFERVYYEQGPNTLSQFRLPEPKQTPELPGVHEETQYEEVKDAV